MDAYVFQADLLCPDCAEAVMQLLRPTDAYRSEDSNVYPQGPYPNGGGEADSPQHCDSCRTFLENPLTEDGIEYVREALSRPTGSDEVKRIWIAEKLKLMPAACRDASMLRDISRWMAWQRLYTKYRFQGLSDNEIREKIRVDHPDV